MQQVKIIIFILLGWLLVINGNQQPIVKGKTDPLAGRNQLFDSSTLTVTPLKPSLGNPVEIVAFGVSGDGCVPKYRSHQVIDNLIRIEADVSSLLAPCAAVVTPWQINIQFDALPRARYIVELYYVPPDADTFLENSTTFLVPTVSRIALPIVESE